MRHIIFRLIIALIWLVVAIIQAVKADLPMAALNGLLGVCFLVSAFRLWKKEKKEER